MEITVFDLTLIGITCVAAVLQSATGFGFGMIVGPVLLGVSSVTDAVQATGMLTFGIVLILTPMLFKYCNRSVLFLLAIGTIIGLPLGYVFQVLLPDIFIRILAALVVLHLLVGLFRPKPVLIRRNPYDKPNLWSGIAVGGISGAMSTALAMPGPVVMGYLSELAMNKTSIRATLLVLMIGSYAGMLGVHFLTQGISSNAVDQTIKLAVPALIGLILGHVLAPHISERIFYILTVLLISGALLSLCIAILQATLVY